MLGAVCINEKYHRKELDFEEILLDETQIQGSALQSRRAKL